MRHDNCMQSFGSPLMQIMPNRKTLSRKTPSRRTTNCSNLEKILEEEPNEGLETDVGEIRK